VIGVNYSAKFALRTHKNVGQNCYLIVHPMISRKQNLFVQTL